MKTAQATELIEQIRQKYSPRNDVTEIDMKIWQKRLIPISYHQATEAIERIFSSDLETYGAMPNIQIFLNHINVEQVRYCLCCDGGGWIILPEHADKNKAIRCVCSSGKRHDRICENILCRNKKKLKRLVVPPKWGYTIKSGVQYCIHNPSVTESVNWDKEHPAIDQVTAKVIDSGLQKENRSQAIPF